MAERALGGGMLLQEQTSDSFTFFWAVLALLWADRDEAASSTGSRASRRRARGSGPRSSRLDRSAGSHVRGEVAEAEAAARLVEDWAPMSVTRTAPTPRPRT